MNHLMKNSVSWTQRITVVIFGVFTLPVCPDFGAIT